MTYEINFKRRSTIEICDALHTLCPGSIWSVGDTYESIKNFKSDEYSLPSKESVLAEVERLQSIADSYQYHRDRAIAYPSIQDQLDTLYHQGYDGWKVTIGEVKNKYPKP
jgi:hypothetical protein